MYAEKAVKLLKYGELREISKTSTFSIEYSEAIVRYVDIIGN